MESVDFDAYKVIIFGGKGGAMSRKIFMRSVLLLSIGIFLSSTVWAGTATEALRQVRNNKPPTVQPLKNQRLYTTPSVSMKAATIKQNKLSSQILNPKALLKQNLNYNMKNMKTTDVKQNKLSSQILPPKSLLKQNINIKSSYNSINQSEANGVNRELKPAIKK